MISASWRFPGDAVFISYGEVNAGYNKSPKPTRQADCQAA
jgi:hypothetical protein